MSGTVIDLPSELRFEVGWACPGLFEVGWTCPGLDNIEDADASGCADAGEEVGDRDNDVPLHDARSAATTATHTRRHWFPRRDRLPALSDAHSREVPARNSPTIPYRLTITIFHAIDDQDKS
jgi:hypothetical protein